MAQGTATSALQLIDGRGTPLATRGRDGQSALLMVDETTRRLLESMLLELQAINSTISPISLLTAKGDLITFDGTSAIRFPVGANGQVLSAASGQTSGLQWITTGTGTLQTIQQGGITVVPSATTLNFVDADEANLVQNSPSGTGLVTTSIYARLGGRAGGQTLFGGNTTTSTLDLRTSSAANYTQPLDVGRGSVALGAVAFDAIRLLHDGMSKDFNSGLLRALVLDGTITRTDTNAFASGQINLFADYGICVAASSGTTGTPFYGSFVSAHTLRPGASGQTAFSGSQGIYYAPRVENSGFTGFVIPNVTAVSTAGLVQANCTVTKWVGLGVGNPSNSGTITTLVGYDIDNLTAGGTNLSIRSAGTAVEMRHAGPAVFGANAAATNPTKTAMQVVGGLLFRRTTFSNVNYTVDNAAGFGDLYLAQTGALTVSNKSVTLPAAATVGAGRVIVVKDEGGNLGGFKITATMSGGDNLDGATSGIDLVTTNRGSVWLVSNGSNAWFRI